MKSILIAALGGLVAALAFPRFGPGFLVVAGLAFFLGSLRSAPSRRVGLLSGLAYGVSFFTGVMWWSMELGLIALVPLVVVQSLFYGWFGWWLAGYTDNAPGRWLVLVAGGWSVAELVRYHFPFSGLEWGGAGYALAGYPWARAMAPIVGVSGLTVLVVLIAAGFVLLIRGETGSWIGGLGIGFAVLAAGTVLWNLPIPGYSSSVDVAIVQGSTPCPYAKCPPNERLGTYEQHLRLTQTIGAGDADLVVWAEGSTGSINADPVLKPEIGAVIGAEARRIGAWILVGSDRPISDTEWINANVVFNDRGEIIGEYQKQQGVPFGEYIPFRPLFDWIPDLEQVPRDMIRGIGPKVFDLSDYRLGSVISFEGSFGRYARQHVREGADLMVVATNEGSYGTTSVSDQLIDMTRMRAAESGTPVVHAAVTGKSVIIDESGAFVSGPTGLGTQEVLFGTVNPFSRSIYVYTADLVMYLAVAAAVLVAWRRLMLLVSRRENP